MIKDYIKQREGELVKKLKGDYGSEILLSSLCCGGDFCEGHNEMETELKNFHSQTIQGLLEKLREEGEKMKKFELGANSRIAPGEKEYNSAISDFLALLDLEK